MFFLLLFFSIFFQQGDFVKLMAKLPLLLAIRLQNKLLYKERGMVMELPFFMFIIEAVCSVLQG